MNFRTKAERSLMMAKIRSRGNKATEMTLASLLRSHRITGWRRHVAIEGTPDFAFPKARLAVFVDGCFWHACKHHCRIPKRNKVYWQRKFLRNKRRDKLVRKGLKENGWNVVRIWEHELKRPGQVIIKIRRLLNIDSLRGATRPQTLGCLSRRSSAKPDKITPSTISRHQRRRR